MGAGEVGQYLTRSRLKAEAFSGRTEMAFYNRLLTRVEMSWNSSVSLWLLGFLLKFLFLLIQ